jgi:hypothetical protein
MKMAVLLIAKVKSLNLRADCHRPEVSMWFVLGLRAAGGCQSAVNLRAGGQGIIIVAKCGIRARDLVIEKNPALAILLRESPCLKLSTRDLKSVKQMRGTLLKPKLSTDGIS